MYGDNMRLVHPEAGLSTEADGVFASKESLLRQRVQLEQGTNSVELVGSPDMVLEIVSPSSVEKDTIHLLNLYHKAGVKEYWLINPLGPSLEFTIYRYSARKYSAVRPQDGWLKSEVFGKSFRLTMTIGDLNLPEFALEVR
jgi:Uma2 family endonuclease